ncbi:hypothetical protein DL93DRAFT_2228435 [Clavulina sp. PMI_390]|nr:hypothetical protein DL93DRAFT_2228435 [Clavulina sp. PMI_390]
MSTSDWVAPNYFYYQIVEDRLALLSKQPFDQRDPTIGRVGANRIQPSTVESFKHALSRLEQIPLSRIISFCFSSDVSSQDQSDIAVLSTVDSAAPGASPARPFIITVSPIINGVAEVALSTTEPGKATSSLCPEGWVTCRPGGGYSHVNVRNPSGTHLTHQLVTGLKLYPKQDFCFVNMKRPSIWLLDGVPTQFYQIVVPSDRSVGWVKSDAVAVMQEA